jgi:hypothetical protein
VYRPALLEADHVSESISHRLAAASSDARQTALARIVGELSEGELRRMVGGARAE